MTDMASKKSTTIGEIMSERLETVDESDTVTGCEEIEE